MNEAQILLLLNTQPCSAALSVAVEYFCLIVTDTVHHVLCQYIHYVTMQMLHNNIANHNCVYRFSM